MAVATSLFALFASAYSLRMEMPDWRPLNEPLVLWTNSAFLVLASIAYQWSRNHVANTDIGSKRVLVGLIIAGIFSVLFLFGQLFAWQQLNDQGMYAS